MTLKEFDQIFINRDQETLLLSKEFCDNNHIVVDSNERFIIKEINLQGALNNGIKTSD